jgi:colicin import membrane protein
MNAPAQAELLPAEDAANLVAKVDENPTLILLGDVGITAYTAALRASVVMPEADIGTAKGRDAIKSAAQSLRTRKAAIDKRRLSLTEGYRAKVAAINEVGKLVTAEMETLIEEVRAPVKAWEKAEENRKAEADRIIADLTAAPTVTFGMTSADVQERLDRIRGMNLNPEILGVRLEMAEDLKADAVTSLTEAVAGLKAQEAQAAELAQLRAAQAAAEQRRIAEEQERAAKEHAEAAAKAEAERIERAKAEAAEQARRDAEAAAERERIERERAAQAEIDAANARAAEAERAAAAERERAEIERWQAEERAKADAEAQREREADIAHRAAVIDAAAEKLTALGLTKKLATAVVNEIAAGNVPAVRITF